MMEEMVRHGKLGRKSGTGFYEVSEVGYADRVMFVCCCRVCFAKTWMTDWADGG
jgi:3-hydroxyacyl-CoA dehydrogenase